MTVTITEFKAKCLGLLEEVRSTGVELVISKHGKPIARVIPENSGQPWMKLRHRGRFDGDAFEPVIAEEEMDVLK